MSNFLFLVGLVFFEAGRAQLGLLIMTVFVNGAITLAADPAAVGAALHARDGVPFQAASAVALVADIATGIAVFTDVFLASLAEVHVFAVRLVSAFLTA